MGNAIYSPPAQYCDPYYTGSANGGYGGGGGGGESGVDHSIYLTIDDALAYYAPITHDHDEYLTDAEAMALPLVHTSLKVLGANGLTGGGDLTTDRTITMVLPQNLSAASLPATGTGATGHSHQVVAYSDGSPDERLLKTDMNGYLKVKTLEASTQVLTTNVQTDIVQTAAGRTLELRPTTRLVKLFSDIQSDDFSSSSFGAGWRIWDIPVGQPNAGMTEIEVDILRARQQLIFPGNIVVREIHVTNGDFFFSAGGTVSATSGGSPYEIVTEQVHGFEVGDLIRARQFYPAGVVQFTSDLEVTAVDPVDRHKFTAVKRTGVTTNAPAIGYEYARVGNLTNVNRQGAVYIASDDSGAPFIDVMSGVSSWLIFEGTDKTRIRLGKLGGVLPNNPITDPSNLQDEYGIYANIKGASAGEDKRFVVSTERQEIKNIPIGMYQYIDVAHPDQPTITITPSKGIAMLGEDVGSSLTPRSLSWFNAVGSTELASMFYEQALTGILSTVRLYRRTGAGTVPDPYVSNKVWDASDAGHGKGINADMLDGKHATEFAAITGAQVLALLLPVDGSGSGLDADLLDNHDTSYFATAAALGAYVKMDASTTITGTQRITGALTLGGGNGDWGVGELYGGLRIRHKAGTWARGIDYYPLGAGTTPIGQMGAYGTDSVLSYFYMGPDYGTTWLKVEAAQTTVPAQLTVPRVQASYWEASSMLQAFSYSDKTVLRDLCNSDSWLRLGAGRANISGTAGADGPSYVDLVGTVANAANYDTRIIRNAGANGSFQVVNKGTANFDLVAGVGAVHGSMFLYTGNKSHVGLAQTASRFGAIDKTDAVNIYANTFGVDAADDGVMNASTWNISSFAAGTGVIERFVFNMNGLPASDDIVINSSGTKSIAMRVKVPTLHLRPGNWTLNETPTLHIGNNSAAALPLAGVLRLYNKSGQGYSIWVDATGDLRISTAGPLSGDTTGTVIGTQS